MCCCKKKDIIQDDCIRKDIGGNLSVTMIEEKIV